MQSNQSFQNNPWAVVAYLTIIGSIIAFFMNQENKSKLVSFHVRQGFGLNLSFLLLGYFIGYFDSWMITSAFYLFFILLWLFGFMGALNNEYREVPILGKLFQKWLKSIE